MAATFCESRKFGLDHIVDVDQTARAACRGAPTHGPISNIKLLKSKKINMQTSNIFLLHPPHRIMADPPYLGTLGCQPAKQLLSMVSRVP